MRPTVLTALAIVQTALAFDGQYSPFSDPLLARSDDELLLVRRQDGCQSGYKSCAADGSAAACCPDGSNCTHDTAGNVACCPTGALCTGVISRTTTGTSLSVSTTTSGVVVSSSPTGAESTITTAFSSPAQLPTSGVQGGGSTVPNTFFPFVYIPTSYANANLCLSAYSYCQSQSTACAESLAGSGVTVSDSGGGGGITIQGASSTTLNPVSASSICSSLSEQACYGLTSAQCGTPTTETGGSTVSSFASTATFFNDGPRQTPCPGAIYAAGAGAFVGGLRAFL